MVKLFGGTGLCYTRSCPSADWWTSMTWIQVNQEQQGWRKAVCIWDHKSYRQFFGSSFIFSSGGKLVVLKWVAVNHVGYEQHIGKFLKLFGTGRLRQILSLARSLALSLTRSHTHTRFFFSVVYFRKFDILLMQKNEALLKSSKELWTEVRTGKDSLSFFQKWQVGKNFHRGKGRKELCMIPYQLIRNYQSEVNTKSWLIKGNYIKKQ